MKGSVRLSRLVSCVVLTTSVLATITISHAQVRSVLTRSSYYGAVTVLEDGAVVSSFEIDPINPYGVAVVGDGSLMWMSDPGDDTVALIDIEGQRIAQTINTGDGPYDITLNSTQTRLYVVNRRDDTLSIIDAINYSLIQTVPAGLGAQGIVVNPDDQTLYLAHDGIQEIEDGVSKRVAADGALIDYIEFPGGWPTGLVISPDGEVLYVALEGSANGIAIAKVDLASFTVSEIVPLSHRPRWMVFHPSGSPLYVSSGFDAALLALDPDTLDVLNELIIAAPGGFDVTPDGKRIHLHILGNSDAFIVDAETLNVLYPVNVGGNSRGFGKFITTRGDGPSDVPAMSEVGILVLALCLTALGTLVLFRRGRVSKPDR